MGNPGAHALRGFNAPCNVLFHLQVNCDKLKMFAVNRVTTAKQWKGWLKAWCRMKLSDDQLQRSDRMEKLKRGAAGSSGKEEQMLHLGQPTKGTAPAVSKYFLGGAGSKCFWLCRLQSAITTWALQKPALDNM